MGIGLPELLAPLPDRVVSHDDPAGEQQLFDIAIAQAEAEIQPHCMADDLGGEAVVLVTIGQWCTHVTSIAHQPGVGQAAQQVDNALSINVGTVAAGRTPSV
jgi:hypothetical protein